jgi:hypothetical protein
VSGARTGACLKRSAGTRMRAGEQQFSSRGSPRTAWRPGRVATRGAIARSVAHSPFGSDPVVKPLNKTGSHERPVELPQAAWAGWRPDRVTLGRDPTGQAHRAGTVKWIHTRMDSASRLSDLDL